MVLQLIDSPFVVEYIIAFFSRPMGIFVDGTVGQVRKLVFELGLVVPLWREPYQAFTVQVDLHRPHLRDCDVDPHVPLHAFYQEWVVDILLQHTLLVILKIVDLVNDRYAPPSAQVWRLADPETGLIAIFVEIIDKLLVLVRHYESQRSKAVDLPVQLLHLFYKSG